MTCVTVAFTVFQMTWLLIFFRMVAGHDPALGDGTARRVTTAGVAVPELALLATERARQRALLAESSVTAKIDAPERRAVLNASAAARTRAAAKARAAARAAAVAAAGSTTTTIATSTPATTSTQSNSSNATSNSTSGNSGAGTGGSAATTSVTTSQS